jgi:hypothetical protein
MYLASQSGWVPAFRQDAEFLCTIKKPNPESALFWLGKLGVLALLA